MIFRALCLASFAIVASVTIYELYSSERSGGRGRVVWEWLINS